MAIRTVELVLLEGATLARESGPGAQNPSLGPGYRKLTLNRDGGAAWRSVGGIDESRAITDTSSRVRVSRRINMTRTSRLLARIGIAAAALTAPLVLAAPALASPMHQDRWDAVAQCESGGNWSTNTGNGYSGGLQFAPSTWRSFGGGAYASTASGATRAQQITIAEKVLHAQGWKAWPTCSKRAGVR
jgi:hypothetical protein